MANITFIIPNRGGEHIDFVISQLRKFYPNEDYIVVTQDDDEPFKRGQLWNIAYNFVETEYMCYIDNDMFWPNYIDLIKEYTCVALQPFDKIAQVKIQDNSYLVTSIENKPKESKGGITFMSKHNFELSNGYSNLYLGWGYEDNEFDDRAHIHNIPCVVNHITHKLRNVFEDKTLDRTHFNINEYAYKTRSNRNIQLDGYKQTTYTITKDEIINNVRYLYTTNIGVIDDFAYKNILNAHYESK